MRATGKDKAEQAALEAISSPLLETSIKGAKGILISMSVSPDVGLEDVDYASTLIAKEANPDANIIWGVSFDQSLEDEMRITIIATGFAKKDEDAQRTVNKVKPNPESPFRAQAPAAQRPAVGMNQPRPAAPAGQRPAAPAAQRPAAPQQRPAAPAPAPAPARKPAPAPKPAVEDDDFDDILSMMKNARKNK